MAFLWRKRADNEKGWLRKLEARLTGRKLEGKPKDEEKNLALKLYLSLQSCTGAPEAIARAWGVDRKTMYNWKVKADRSPTMVIERKTRKDAGESVFTSDKRRSATVKSTSRGWRLRGRTREQ
jgi:DNA invertase Pin-like site-specific DNA recombinase